MGSSAKVHSNEVGELSERVGVEEPSFQSGGGTGFQALIGVAGLERKQGPLPLLWLHIGIFFQTLMRGSRKVCTQACTIHRRTHR